MASLPMWVLAATLACIAVPGLAQQHPRDAEIPDADTRAWWHTTESLSGDAMEGRDTGSAAYERAAQYVASRFRAAGLKGVSAGSYFQHVPMHEIAAVAGETTFTLVQTDGTQQPLRFLEQVTLTPVEGLPEQLEAPLTFRGYCGRESMDEVAGKIVVCFGTQRTGLPSSAARLANAREGRAAGLINVDDPYFTIEPPRWPYAYARTVTLRADTMGRSSSGSSATPSPSDAGTAGERALVSMRLSADAFALLLAGTRYDAQALLKDGGARHALPNFDLPVRLRVHTRLTERDISSPNVLGVLPGSDPALRDQYVVLSAHLDGYGFGTPVNGDNLYNGTLDDAAYVALLIQLADDLQAGRHARPRRSLLFAAFTGEEKGLLGSRWFVAHPTVPLAQLAANVNLDQLRPLFPLKILTVGAVDESTLGATVRGVAASLHIQIRADAEPERNLLRRADQYPFLLNQVPAVSFIFGYDPGTESERRYREWYQVRYHRPQDDLTQPVDFTAAAHFNQFFYRLVEAIASDPVRPALLPASQFARPTTSGSSP